MPGSDRGKLKPGGSIVVSIYREESVVGETCHRVTVSPDPVFFKGPAKNTGMDRPFLPFEHCLARLGFVGARAFVQVFFDYVFLHGSSVF